MAGNVRLFRNGPNDSPSADPVYALLCMVLYSSYTLFSLLVQGMMGKNGAGQLQGLPILCWAFLDLEETGL